jgi:hypothetical protein
MRLNVPLDVDELLILKGPGATHLFETTVEKMKSPDTFFPKLRFTVMNPDDSKPMEVYVVMHSNWKQVQLHYELDGVLQGNDVRVEYRFFKDGVDSQGSIVDR